MKATNRADQILRELRQEGSLTLDALLSRLGASAASVRRDLAKLETKGLVRRTHGGVQFDRTASIFLGNTNIYFGTTPEPLPVATNTWHIERDITDYSALLTTPQTGTMVLANCTTDCAPPFDTLNGVFTVKANLQFYPADSSNTSATGAADMVLPLEQVNDTGGVNLPALLFSPTDQLSTTFTFPKNVERAYLDVISQSQSTDEQWYACFPNDLSNINEVYGCGNTDFRETEVTIDGQPAGIAPVSP